MLGSYLIPRFQVIIINASLQRKIDLKYIFQISKFNIIQIAQFRYILTRETGVEFIHQSEAQGNTGIPLREVHVVNISIVMHLSMLSRRGGRQGIGRGFDFFAKNVVKFPTPGFKFCVKSTKKSPPRAPQQ